MTTITNINANVDAIEARRGAFEALMENANNACFDDDGNVIVKIATAHIDLLEIDARYQGDRQHKRTFELAEKWDWRKYDMITVVPHYDTCTLSVVNGQNRTNAARIKGIKKLPVRILWGVSLNEEERLKAEANWFIHQDEQIDKLRPVEKHKALLIMGDKAATELQNALDKYGITYKTTRGSRSGRILGSYSEGLYIAKHFGADGLEFIYSIIDKAKWADEHDGYSTNHVRALLNLYRLYDKKDREKISKYLSKELKNSTPWKLSADARSKYPLRDARMATTIYLDDMLVNAGIVERKVFPAGATKVEFLTA